MTFDPAVGGYRIAAINHQMRGAAFCNVSSMNWTDDSLWHRQCLVTVQVVTVQRTYQFVEQLALCSNSSLYQTAKELTNARMRHTSCIEI